ncbi:ABC transporter ATP-binding protein [Niallia sp. Krafla_26]|uniref:ABC transporter ATP-binding protein n=1 Tax=Niallia sp. Krafla_26 TaxID=3064703 RepID=UPI003D166027
MNIQNERNNILELSDVTIKYGAITAVRNVSLHVKKGQIVALIGTNGSGKTSILKAISAITPVDSGEITFNGNLINKVPTHKIVHSGISHVPEGRGIFPELKVYENLRIGAYTRKDKAEIKADEENMYRLFTRLAERKNQVAGTLSGGEQQMLSIARALMARPQLLLLDEPSMGLAPIMAKEIFKIIKEINEMGTTILLIEQNANLALSISDYGYVIETGEVVYKGDQQELMNDSKIKEIYLGI